MFIDGLKICFVPRIDILGHHKKTPRMKMQCRFHDHFTGFVACRGEWPLCSCISPITPTFTPSTVGPARDRFRLEVSVATSGGACDSFGPTLLGSPPAP